VHGETTDVQHSDDSRSKDSLGRLEIGLGVADSMRNMRWVVDLVA